MPNPLTDDQRALAIQLRSTGMPYVKVAAKVGCSETAVFKFLKQQSIPEPPPLRKPKASSTVPENNPTPKFSLLPEYKLNSSCPIRRKFSAVTMNLPQLTKAQMYYDLHQAVLRTTRL
jgi:hypothetical protein